MHSISLLVMPMPYWSSFGHELAAAGNFHELFDAQLMQGRRRLGLPIDRRDSLDELPEPLRSQTEAAYLDACREVGQLLLQAGRFREAWVYLRPVGDKRVVRECLAKTIPDEDNVEELIDVALYEGVDAERGFAWLLGDRGTCNSITAFESLAGNLPISDQRDCAVILVRHLHRELSTNILAHIEQHEGTAPEASELQPQIDARPWLFQNENHHVDTSHLAATVRFARLADTPEILRLALDMAEYGRRLARSLQFPGEEPFVDVFPSHRLFFAALLGEQVDESVRFFARRAEEVSLEEHGTGAIEVYLSLLARLGRPAAALDEFARLVPPGTAFLPTPRHHSTWHARRMHRRAT